MDESRSLEQQIAQSLANGLSKRMFPPVMHLDMFVTEDCNCRCPYCFVEGKRPKSMSRETALKSLEFLLEYGRGYAKPGVLFFGGEPLLEFDLMHYIVEKAEELQEGRKVEFNYSITTNGTLLNKDMLAFFREKNIKFLLSMDGNRETHDRYRTLVDGTPTFDMLVERLKWFKSYQPWMGVRLTVAPGTAARMPDDVLFLYSKGINQFIIGPVTGVEWNSSQLKEYENALHAVARVYLEKKKRKEPFRMTLFEADIEKEGNLKDKWGCGAGKGRLSVTADGDLQGCAKIQGVRNLKGFMPLGNVHTGFFNMNNRALLCSDMVKRRKKCMDCEIRDECGGGCPAVNFVESGDIFIPSEWNCEFARITVRLRNYIRRMKKELEVA